jgi:hypothetical protein
MSSPATCPKTAVRIADGSTTSAEFKAEYPRTFCMNCWPMNMAPMREPKVMAPATKATQ